LPNVIHPSILIHDAVAYDLSHLISRQYDFGWVGRRGEPLTFQVRVTYSNHVYSDAKLEPFPGCASVLDRGVERVFCPSRHARSLGLPQIFADLASRPVTTVGVLAKNFNVYRIVSADAVYYVFFNLRAKTRRERTHVLSLFVESAYDKPAAVRSRMKMPFGQLCERIAMGDRI
jgi:hypothetical protein